MMFHATYKINPSTTVKGEEVTCHARNRFRERMQSD